MSRLKRTTLLTVPLFVMVSLVAGAMPAQAVCSTGVMCIWQDINYMNTKGTFTGDNSDWNSDFSPQNFWGDSVSSAFADISTHVLAMYQNIDGKYGQDFESSNPNFVVCLDYNVNSSDSSDFVNIPDPQDGIFTDGTFNDEASSDVVFQGSSTWCDVLN